MARSDLVNFWLLEAADNAEDPKGVAEQVAYLKEQRATYAPAVKAGDWENMSVNDAGGSGSFKRGVSDLAQHEAIVAALAKLGATPLGEGGALIQPLFRPGVG